MIGEDTNEVAGLEGDRGGVIVGEEREEFIREVLDVDPDEISSVQDLVEVTSPDEEAYEENIESMINLLVVLNSREVNAVTLLIASDEGIHSRASLPSSNEGPMYADSMVRSLVDRVANYHGVSTEEYLREFIESIE